MASKGYLELKYIVRCTSDSVQDRLQIKRKWAVSRLIYQLAEVGIDSQDIVVGDVASLPNYHNHRSAQLIFILKSRVLYLSQPFPITLHFRGLFSPLFANDF
jgi:hypothetical protein